MKYDSLPANVTISTIDDDLSALLAAADLVITFNSTLGLEGVLIGKPLVTIDVSVQCQYLPYSKMGLSTGVPRITDLERGVLEAMRSPSRPKEPLPVPGNATENIYQAILNLLR